MNTTQASTTELIRMAAARFLPAVVVLSMMFFLPAGTFAYWQAWVYMTILFIPMLLVLIYLIKNDPELLERRMKTRERETQQKLIVKLAVVQFLVAFLLPGFDIRFGWSNVPVGIVVMAEVLVFLGYVIFFLVLVENRYASRVIEVEQKQQVISSGPYAVVRHPMYAGILILYIFSPLALGSYWAMIPILLVIPGIVARIRNEEDVLARDLKGYPEYMQKIRFRLIPGIW